VKKRQIKVGHYYECTYSKLLSPSYIQVLNYAFCNSKLWEPDKRVYLCKHIPSHRHHHCDVKCSQESRHARGCTDKDRDSCYWVGFMGGLYRKRAYRTTITTRYIMRIEEIKVGHWYYQTDLVYAGETPYIYVTGVEDYPVSHNGQMLWTIYHTHLQTDGSFQRFQPVNCPHIHFRELTEEEQIDLALKSL